MYSEMTSMERMVNSATKKKTALLSIILAVLEGSLSWFIIIPTQLSYHPLYLLWSLDRNSIGEFVSIQGLSLGFWPRGNHKSLS